MISDEKLVEFCIVVSCTELFTDGAVNAIPSNVTIKGDRKPHEKNCKRNM